MLLMCFSVYKSIGQNIPIEAGVVRQMLDQIDSCKQDKWQVSEFTRQLRYNDSLISKQKITIDGLTKDLRGVSDHNDDLSSDNFHLGESVKKRGRAIWWLSAAGALLGTGLILK